MRLILAAALLLSSLPPGWTQTAPGGAPDFTAALISAVDHWGSGSDETPARRSIRQALSDPKALAELCALLDGAGDPGRQAEAKLKALAGAAPAAPAAARQASLRAASAKVAALQNAKWDRTSSGVAFDGGAFSGAAAEVRAPSPASRPQAMPALKKSEPKNSEEKQDASVVRLVSISVEKLQELAVNKDPDERKLQLEKPFALGPGPISGAGVFTSKVLSDEDLKADPAKQAAAEAAAKKGQPVDFVRTNAKI